MAAGGAAGLADVRPPGAAAAAAAAQKENTEEFGASCARTKSTAYEELQTHVARSMSSVHMVWLFLVLALGFAVDVVEFCYFDVFVADGPFWKKFVQVFVMQLVFKLRLTLISLAPIVEDELTRVVVLWDILVIFGEKAIVFYHCRFGFGTFHCWFFLACHYGEFFLFAGFGLWSLLSASTSAAQRRLWRGIAILLICSIAKWSYFVLRNFPAKSWHVANIFASVPALYVALCPEFRSALQGKLQSVMKIRSASAGATSLAGLMGSATPGEAKLIACRRFRCVAFPQLTFDAMLGGLPDAAHVMLSKPCALGSCDAFISHSQGDDDKAKWKALQAWARLFKQRHSREPSLWLDKFCIEQSCVDTDLQCLPIFLRGCKHLVLLCGPTYLSCSRTIFHVFTYVRTGGDVEDIELVQVLREGFEFEDARAIEACFDEFEAWYCQSSESSERQRIVAIIEAACGSLDTFNESMRIIIKQLRQQLRVQSPFVPIVVPRGPDIATSAMLDVV